MYACELGGSFAGARCSLAMIHAELYWLNDVES